MPRRQRRAPPALSDVIISLQLGLDRRMRRLEQFTTAKTVHDCRVAARKLTVVARSLRRKPVALPTRRMSRALKQLIQELGPARDSDVRMVTLRSVAAEPPLLALAAAQQRGQRRELSNLTKSVRWVRRRNNFNRCSTALAQRLRTAPPAQEAVLGIILRRNRSLRRRLRRNPTSPASIHRLRLRIKELRYLLETLGTARTDLNCIDPNLLGHLQRYIGDFHDLWGAAQWMREIEVAEHRRLKKALRSAEARMHKHITLASRTV